MMAEKKKNRTLGNRTTSLQVVSPRGQPTVDSQPEAVITAATVLTVL